MPIVVHLKREITRRGIKQNDLAQAIGISPVNLSRIARNHGKAIRFSTLDSLCGKLGCGVGDLLTYEPAPSTCGHCDCNELEKSEQTKGLGFDQDDSSCFLVR